MSARARGNYARGVGPEVTYKRRPKLRPIFCQRPTCEAEAAPVIPGRACCEQCAGKLEARAAELRERQARKGEAA